MALPVYIPGSDIVQIHGWNRPNAADGMRPAPSIFTADTANGKAYYEGVISLAAAYFVIGGLCFLTYAIVNSLSLCCRSRATADKPRSSCGNMCRCIFNPTFWYIGAVVVMLAGTAAALAQVNSLRSTIDSVGNSLTSFTDLLTSASVRVSNELTNNLQNTSDILGRLKNDCVPLGCAGQIQPIIDSVQQSLNSSGSLASQLNSSVTAINAKLQTGSISINKVGENVYRGGAISLGLFFGFLALTVIALCPKRACACTFRVCNIFVVITFLLVYIFAGIFMSAALIGSDICVDPSNALISVANLTSAGPSATATLSYYSTCVDATGTAAPPTTASGAAWQLVNGANQFNAALSSLDTFSSDPLYALLPPADTAAVNASIIATGASIRAVVGAVSCAPVNGIYYNLVQSLCNTGVHAIIATWALSTAACILMFVIATSASRLCWRHPGDDAAKPADARHAAVWGEANAAPGTGLPQPATYIAMSPQGAAAGSAAAYN